MGAALLVLLASGCGALFGVHVDALLLTAAALGSVVLGTALVARAVAHARLSRHLARASRPTTIAAMSVRSVPGAGPMVAGLVRPLVYCGEDVARRLSPREQTAVLLHERCHQLRRDPVRLVWLDALDALLRRVPIVRHHVDRARADLEIRADQYAVHHGATRQDLASALLTLSDQAAVPAAGFGTVTARRLDALLDGPSTGPRRRRLLLVAGLVGLLAASAACGPMLSSSHPELMFAARCLTGACGLGG